MSKSQTLTVVNESGRAFVVKLVRAGERWGRSGTEIANRHMIEFYDATYAGKKGFDPEGQFVTNYYVYSLMSAEWGNSPAQLRRSGLALDMGSPNWNVSGANMSAIFDWLLSVLA